MTEVILFWYKLLVHRKLELLNFLAGFRHKTYLGETVDRDTLGQRIISSSSRSKSLVHRFSLLRLADILQLRAVCGPLFREFSTNCLSKPSG